MNVWNMNAASVLNEVLSADETAMKIKAADYSNFIGSHAAGDHFHVVLRDATHMEIVKVNITRSSLAGGLAVDRAQQGTAARQWGSGTAVYQELTAGDLDDIYQKAAFRTIDYIPDGVLASLSKGEKVYQSDLQLWWKAVDVGTEWRLIAGEIVVATPVFDPASGTILPGQSVTITCTTPGANIYYTLDGSTPGIDAEPYSDPIVITQDTEVKAIAIGPERYHTDSAVATGNYNVPVFNIVGSQATGEFAVDVWGDGNYIYVAAADSSLVALVFDGSSFAVAGIENGNANSVWGDGTYIYVADFEAGIKAFSFNGTSFTLRGSYNTNGWAYRTWGDGTYVYVADYVGIKAFTFNGSSFSLVGSYNTSGNCVGVWGDGTYIYALAGSEGVIAFTFNGSSFTVAGSYNTTGTAYSMWGYGHYLYVADYEGGVIALSFNGAAFALLDTYSCGAIGVWGDGTYVYIADHTFGITALTFMGSSFALAGSLETDGIPTSVWGDGNYYYLAAYDAGIKALTFE